MNKYETLEKLAKLKDEGILSEEEFVNEKSKILSNNLDNIIDKKSDSIHINKGLKSYKKLVIITTVISLFVILIFQWYSIYVFFIIGLIYFVQVNQKFRFFSSLSLIGLSIFGVILLFILNQEFNNAEAIYNTQPKYFYTPTLSEKIDTIRNSMLIMGILSVISLISGIYLLLTRKLTNNIKN